jgi:hypothetical protein
MKYPILFTLITLISLTLGSCSLFKKDFQPFTSVAPNQETTTSTPSQEPKLLSEVEVQALPERSAHKDDSITIKWLVPDQTLDGYVIRYGFSPTSLDYEERLRWTQLTIDTDPEKRKIFIHTLRGLPVDRPIFLSIAGLRDDQLSPPSAIFSVQPIEKKDGDKNDSPVKK